MTEQDKKKTRAGYGDKVRNKERRSELTIKEKLDWITQMGFVGGKESCELVLIWNMKS